MTRDEQKKYWDTLCALKGDINTVSEERNTLLSSIQYPESLFRFRAVSENSLQALQDNLMYFSSADFYDDPFDTSLKVNIGSIWNEIKNIQQNTDLAVESFNKSFPEIPINASWLMNIEINDTRVKSQIAQLRSILQKSLYSVCFCEDVLNETLWLKYAENHRGFVLEYSINQTRLDTVWNSDFHANILPIYYSDDRYDAYKYAVYLLTLSLVKDYPDIYGKLSYMQPICWENTKITTIKKSCHEHDNEWRLIPLYALNCRKSINWTPVSVTFGLRMPEYKRKLVLCAAQIAGIPEIYEMYIDEDDNFKRRPI